MADLASVLGDLAGSLFKAGAPQLGTIIGGAIGGPLGGLAGKVVGTLAEALGTAVTPEAVKAGVDANPGAVAPVEAAAPEMVRVYELETQRGNDAQAAEIEKGFGAWQFWRGAWQALIVGGWAVVLLTALFGGAWVKPLLPMGEVVSAWTGVTMTWLAAYNGGHTLKQIAPFLGFGRRK